MNSIISVVIVFETIMNFIMNLFNIRSDSTLFRAFNDQEIIINSTNDYNKITNINSNIRYISSNYNQSNDNVVIQFTSFDNTLELKVPIGETKLFTLYHKHTVMKMQNIFYIYVDKSYDRVILTLSSFSDGFHKNNILRKQEFLLGDQTREGFDIFDNISNAFFEVDKFLETNALLKYDKVYSFKRIIERLKPIAVFLLVIVFILLGLPMTLLKEQGTINYNKYFSLLLQKILLYIVIFEEFNGFNFLIDGLFPMMKIFLFGSSSLFSPISVSREDSLSLNDLFILSSSYNIMNKDAVYFFLNIALIVNVSLAFIYIFISIYFLPVAFIISMASYYDDLIKKIFEKIISCITFIFLHNFIYTLMVAILNSVVFSMNVSDDTSATALFDISLLNTGSLLNIVFIYWLNIFGYIFHLVFLNLIPNVVIGFYIIQGSSFIEKLSGFIGFNTIGYAYQVMDQASQSGYKVIESRLEIYNLDSKINDLESQNLADSKSTNVDAIRRGHPNADNAD